MRIPKQQRKSYAWRWTAALAGLAVLAFALVVALAMRPAEPVRAATFTVNSLADTPDIQDTVAPFGALNALDGVPDGICDVDPGAATTCTLRAAIFEANANGDAPDTINISVTGTITLGSPLPLGATTATGAPADGTTIDAGTLGNLVLTCGVGGFSAFEVTGAGNTIRDFVINGCTGAAGNGVRITGDSADSNTVTFNRIGTNPGGTVAVANGAGVLIDNGADSNTISNNLLSGNSPYGVEIDDAGTLNNVIWGNYIGTDVAGTAALPNAFGIYDTTSGATTIGGTTLAARNIISGNTFDGIFISGSSATVQGNCIGTTRDCATPRPNGDDGVDITGANNLIGGTVAGAGNIIQSNVDDGVEITGAHDFNRVTHNTIALNGGMGILCGTAAVNCDGGGGHPNEGVTTPVITGCADAGSGNVSCNGTVPAPFAIAGVTVEVYLANVDGGGAEGQGFLCPSTTVAGGSWGCTFANPGGGSATATATTTSLSTSEFSVPAGIPPGVAPTATFTPTATLTPTATGTPPTSTPTPTVTGTPPTSTPTPTRTGTPPTSTPTPTPTPTTGTMQTVTLIGAICNPEASTYADSTPIATIGGAVTPSGILISIWWFDPATISWFGYSPNVSADVNNLAFVDRLEAIFICVSTAGDWSRPLI